MLTPKQEKILQLAEVGGKDSDLIILDIVDALETKLDETLKEIKAQFETAVADVKTGIPHFDELLKSIKTLAEKEIPAPEINIPAPIVNITPQIKIESPKIEAPIVNIPAPIVNVKAEVKAEKDEELLAMVEDMKTDYERTHEKIFEDIKAIKESVKEGRRSGGGGGQQSVRYYDISSSLDGVTKTFWIPTNMGIIAVIGSSAPFIFRPTVDWVESGHNIVFDVGVDASLSLAAGQSVIILIKRN